MTPTQFKLIAAALAFGGALGGGGAAYILTHSGGDDASTDVALPTAAKGTQPHWSARVTSIAGDGLPGANNGHGRSTRFADPFGVVIDGAGNLYVADGGDNNSIRKIALDGATTTLAGGVEGYAEGAGKAAAFNTPSGLAIDAAGNLYVADTGNNAIRKVTPEGVVSTLAGDGLPGDKDGRGAAAQFNGPVGIAVDAAGVVYVADTYNDRIRRIAPNGDVTTIAGGSRAGKADGAAAQALFDTPTGLALSAAGDLYIADTGNHAIRKLGKDGKVSTIAQADDDDRNALLRAPVGLALTPDGYLYASSNSHGRLAQITPAGDVLTLDDADHPPQPGYGSDGSVRLYAPRGVALAKDGSLFVTDAATFRLHHVALALAGQAAAPELPLPPAPSHSATMLWPVKPQDKAHEVVGLMGEVRGNFDGESRDHFHSGLDVQAAIGTPVLAVTAGKVADPRASWGYGELSEGLSLDGLQYIHMRVGRGANDKLLDPRFQLLKDEKGVPAAVRVKRGTRFVVGETLGTVNRMAHVHLDYKPNGDALNPLTLPFVDLEDTIAPQIQSIALTDSSGKPLKEKVDGRLLVPRALGEVQIVVDAFDQMNGNQARRRLGLYKLGYQLLNADGEVIPGMEQALITQLFDRLPRNREAVKLAYSGSSGITVHGAAETRFSYAINNTLIHGKLTPGAWKVGALGPGHYTLRITAEDYAGNAASKGRDLLITVD
ncbi:gluconolaconase [Janthinobacterium sp. HH01]|uniref:gluconolaconase n=1 Tax=Janthinobacterium sp. HH01 TaxID=1198452 RepID=UPI00034DD32C|nr:gluconolaconase [Janthinobacterium sp. HH01]